MLKKSITCSFAIVALAIGSQAYAGSFSGPGATTVSPASGAAQVCTSLTNDITVQLSNGINAGFDCSGGGFRAATCAVAGTNKSQTIPCTYTPVTEQDDPDCVPGDGVTCDSSTIGYTASDDQCPARTVGQNVDPTTATFVGRVGFLGAGGGGTVGAVNLRGACTTANVESITQP
jgi:hypothetical protein